MKIQTYLTLAIALVVSSACSISSARQCPNCAKNGTMPVSIQQDQERTETTNEANDIVNTAVRAGTFRTLVAAVEAAELVETLKSEGPFTVLAPSDDAFAALPEGTVESLLLPENRDQLIKVLTYHVIPAKAMAADVVNLTEANTVAGRKLMITAEEGSVKINDANVTATDIECSNGVIHVIDKVLIPGPQDIVDTAVSAGSFNTLAAALTTAELVETLKGEGPFTVFAPTDEAFAALPEGTVAALLTPEKRDSLTSILTFHVVAGKVMAEDVVNLQTAETVNGASLAISVDEDGKVTINGATVITTDIQCSNGVIHVIDKVMIPN